MAELTTSTRPFELATRLLELPALATRPSFVGLENLPADGRMLLVGNHTIYGVLDVPFMAAEIWRRRGLRIRALGDHTHWRIPLWGELLGQLGAVPGTRENCATLMQAGEPILVFPGGSREVNKRKGEAYQLFWRERIGFARMAIEHDYPVVPFSAVGAEEMLDVVLDVNNPIWGGLSRVTERLLDVGMPSLVRGIGPTPIPRPQQLSFRFGEAIDAGAFKSPAGKATDAGARKLRKQVQREVEVGIAELRAVRGAD